MLTICTNIKLNCNNREPYPKSYSNVQVYLYKTLHIDLIVTICFVSQMTLKKKKNPTTLSKTQTRIHPNEVKKIRSTGQMPYLIKNLTHRIKQIPKLTFHVAK